MSSANGAQLTQWPPTGTAHHRWRFIDSGGGHFRNQRTPPTRWSTSVTSPPPTAPG
ncbi:RICIN domain-containing protein [Micromonospora sp. DT201]|uniref:RICIN domain-containing protein n=1 Tax=Micromonospora sp. DT201 TaxID=3393442 RepID=UPI003CF08338